MTREELEKVVSKTIEWLNSYAFVDAKGYVHLPTLTHDFLKESRTYYDILLQNPHQDIP